MSFRLQLGEVSVAASEVPRIAAQAPYPGYGWRRFVAPVSVSATGERLSAFTAAKIKAIASPIWGI
ncbi:hypothetical protein NUKP37_24350 [Klebsiella variicola]|uniref:Uncharacterized protein n=1 Tax=Klebsiella variicola TaxID=244366 RepID=A0A9P3P770_KLEVA|nr:hypothetical protein JUNP254_4022 [Klebsiella pneumoniae]GFM41035.1 hypothetical protein MAKP1_23770 [Klebsiella pneumoniae subsp. pneumoniae]GKI56491.1 hypothetical protein NUKP6_05870 [Klebsiella variicola]BCI96846.1 hypothetical protein VNKP15269_C38400 [Klebsiella pneumoniae]BCU18650.1 hypothetical protein MAKP3_38740 [Klebsiella pneumoniae]